LTVCPAENQVRLPNRLSGCRIDDLPLDRAPVFRLALGWLNWWRLRLLRGAEKRKQK
jgi:hypothetical protein